MASRADDSVEVSSRPIDLLIEELQSPEGLKLKSLDKVRSKLGPTGQRLKLDF